MLRLHTATQPQNNVFPVSAPINLQHHPRSLLVQLRIRCNGDTNP
jgi:hypothetical protein